jgi:hypothetical protein
MASNKTSENGTSSEGKGGRVYLDEQTTENSQISAKITPDARKWLVARCAADHEGAILTDKDNGRKYLNRPFSQYIEPMIRAGFTALGYQGDAVAAAPVAASVETKKKADGFDVMRQNLARMLAAGTISQAAYDEALGSLV